jgi:WhiB family redox-sensing transcriptional regulator
MDWRNEAQCQAYDPELFFPVGTTGPAQVQTEEAKAVCIFCPVRVECLTWAFDTGQDSGVWGGMSEAERRAVVRQGRVQHALAMA